MALIDCPDCSGKLSTNAERCPHCGAPAPRIRPKGLWFWQAIMGILLVAIITQAFIVIGDLRRSTAQRSVYQPHKSQPVTPNERDNFDQWFTRDDYTRACREAVHGMATYRARFGNSTTDLLGEMRQRGGECVIVDSGFKCVVGTTPMEIRVSGPSTFKDLRLGFMRTRIDGYGDSGCCAGVAEAVKQYPGGKFEQHEGGCSVKFVEVAPIEKQRQ